MIRFVFGGAGCGKSEFVLNEIEKELENSDKNIYLIVPEQQTVVYETKLAERFPPESALRLEATNFTRLADSVARRAGGLSYNNFTKGGRTLITWRAMLSVWNSLESFNRVSSGSEDKLVPLIESAIEELKINSVSPEDIEKAFDEGECDDVSFRSRMMDLALIRAACESIASEEYDTENDVLARLYRQLSEFAYFKGSDVYIDSFFSVTKEEHRIITEIMKTADNVTFTVSMPDKDADGIHFDAVKQYYKSLLSEAARFDEVQFITLKENRRAKYRELEIIEKYLFDYTVSAGHAAECCNQKPSDPDSVRVLSVADRYEEAEAAACEIERLVRRGAKYSDIAVIAHDITSLHGITDTCFRRHSIPCFVAKSEKIESSPLTRHFLSLLNIVGSWRREDVIRLVKTGLTPLDDMESCIFEKYTSTWNIRGKHMFTSEWSMNPDGYKQEMSNFGKKSLLIANNAREKLIAPVERFAEVFKGGEALVEDVCRAMVQYAEDIDLYGAMLRFAQKLEDSGDADSAARERLVWEKLCECFDMMAQLLPDVTADATRFSSLFRFALTDADAGAIPTGVDEVALGSATGIRTGEVKHVILLGCVEGEFPGTADEGRFFTDADKIKLEELGINLWGTSGERSSMELFRFWKAACMASESLTLMVPKSSAGSECAISQGASRVLELMGRERPVNFSSLPLRERLYHPSSLDAAIGTAASSGDENMCEALTKLGETFPQKHAFYAEDSAESTVSEKTASGLFPSRINLTQSRLNSYVQCPFAYYLKYTLRLSEDKKAEISAPDVGIFVHAVLEEFFVATKGVQYPLDREETEKICDGLIEDYIQKTCGAVPQDSRLKYLFLRLKRGVLVFVEAVMREFAQSRFQIYSAEMKFGDKDETAPEPLEFKLDDGTVVSMYGIVDRMDVLREGDKSYIRVVDYKTGAKKFSLDDVKLGLNIQLLLYLFSAWKAHDSKFAGDIAPDGEILPAGALYFSVRPGDMISDVPLSAEEAREKMIDSIDRSGLVLDDREVLEAMDRGISGRYIPVTLKADGSIKKSASLATLEKFGELYREMEDAVCRIAKEMKSGDAAARPLEHHGSVPCSWCSMKSVCRSFVQK